MGRVRRVLGRWGVRLGWVGFAVGCVGLCAGGPNGWAGTVLIAAGMCLWVLAGIALYLWLVIWLVTIPMRFVAWLTQGGGAGFARRLAGFLLVTFVVLPGALILDILLGECFPEPVSKLGWHWKAIGLMVACLGLGPLVTRVMESIDAGEESLWDALFHDAEG